MHSQSQIETANKKWYTALNTSVAWVNSSKTGQSKSSSAKFHKPVDWNSIEILYVVFVTKKKEITNISALWYSREVLRIKT